MSQLKACTTQTVTLTSAELPLCCPMPNFRVWDAHPRVYLPIAVTGEAACPYCGTQYHLTDFTPGALHGSDVEEP
ncbi:MAG: zinc-finger domain-containing protein [Gammaproteobacteria bacterium]